MAFATINIYFGSSSSSVVSLFGRLEWNASVRADVPALESKVYYVSLDQMGRWCSSLACGTLEPFSFHCESRVESENAHVCTYFQYLRIADVEILFHISHFHIPLRVCSYTAMNGVIQAHKAIHQSIYLTVATIGRISEPV